MTNDVITPNHSNLIQMNAWNHSASETKGRENFTDDLLIISLKRLLLILNINYS